MRLSLALLVNASCQTQPRMGLPCPGASSPQAARRTKQVWAGGMAAAEQPWPSGSAPDLLGQVLVPAELLGQDLGADLGVVARAYFPLVDRLCQAVLNRPRLSHNRRQLSALSSIPMLNISLRLITHVRGPSKRQHPSGSHLYVCGAGIEVQGEVLGGPSIAQSAMRAATLGQGGAPAGRGGCACWATWTCRCGCSARTRSRGRTPPGR